ncbi:MAG: HEAT repeat domain-containing protein [Nitrospirales bacterium]|nr:HEAT repeat domain-containing protein [Nitrospira sp.]MDR4502685.1 HEAT repeat domain-containing protein [Nitrospirales bacterium]
MQTRMMMKNWRVLTIFLAVGLYVVGWPMASAELTAKVVLVQNYEPPPQAEFPDIQKATPAPETLTQQDRDRLESLVPLLEGRQELWAMGEFVHYGKHSVPFVVKALTMPGARIRYNAIETLSMIKDPSSVSELLNVAKDPNEISRVRSHALRVATRLDSTKVLPAIKEMAKDENSTVRLTAAFEARSVRQKEILPILIGIIADPEEFVSVTARESFWRLTGFSGSRRHNWEASTLKDRKEWSQEWRTWLKENESRFGPPANPQPQQSPTPSS